jgi:hypothetical protein
MSDATHSWFVRSSAGLGVLSAEVAMTVSERGDLIVEPLEIGAPRDPGGEPACPRRSRISPTVGPSSGRLGMARVHIDLDGPRQVGHSEVESNSPVAREVEVELAHEPHDPAALERETDADLGVRLGCGAGESAFELDDEAPDPRTTG